MHKQGLIQGGGGVSSSLERDQAERTVSQLVYLVQEFHGPVTNHTGRAHPQWVMNSITCHMNLRGNVLPNDFIGPVVNYQSMKFLNTRTTSQHDQAFFLSWSRN